MFTEEDKIQFAEKGISIREIEIQLDNFRRGFPALYIHKPATTEDGIFAVEQDDADRYIRKFENSLHNVPVTKFVPASGAATRMFKDLFEFSHHINQYPGKTAIALEQKEYETVKRFYKELRSFAFYEDLIAVSGDFEHGKSLSGPEMKRILEIILLEKGLNLGNSPKGLIKFHSYPGGSRTSLEEHLVEGAHYARNIDGTVHIHLTVSPEHLKNFEKKVEEILPIYEKMLEVDYHITFSVQKTSTDTLAVDPENRPFRLIEGSILFRPGGHGALLENLNGIDSGIIFIKNIDNVVPDRLKEETIRYKKILAGILLEFQGKIFHYLRMLHSKESDSEELSEEIARFLERDLNIIPPGGLNPGNPEERNSYYRKKLNRPIRVCGMVKNEGEPGGGPFWAKNADGTISLQIVESSQVDMDQPDQREKFLSATYFNPVDLICGVKDFNGQKFNLLNYRDPETGFISKKSKDGRQLKALELPGLWNGAMADWNTVFVEVPIITFNPVKTINDLMRPEHQPD